MSKKNREERITKLLGVSHGAAATRLRKMVLFRQLKKYSDNICVRCKLPIENVDELSIEHIEPWEGRSAELFWDLGNVAFSHLKCNVQHYYNSNNADKRKLSPEGMSWCRMCKQDKSVDDFAKKQNRWNNLRHDCRECEKKYKDLIRYGEQRQMVGSGPENRDNSEKG